MFPAQIKAKLAVDARILLRAMNATYRRSSTAQDEAEIDFERTLIMAGKMDKDDFIEDIHDDDVIDPKDESRRLGILVVTLGSGRILQVTVLTGEVLVVVE